LPDEAECRQVFKALDRLDAHLEGKQYLFGNQLTLADVRAYTTSIRFDVAYVSAFRCNLRMLRSYKNVNSWLKNLYWNYPEFKDTTNIQLIKEGYHIKFAGGIVPLGPLVPIEPL